MYHQALEVPGKNAMERYGFARGAALSFQNRRNVPFFLQKSGTCGSSLTGPGKFAQHLITSWDNSPNPTLELLARRRFRPNNSLLNSSAVFLKADVIEPGVA